MKTVLLFSGGYDSVAALDIALKDMKSEVLCLFVDYGQPYAAQEFSAAMYAFKHYESKKYPIDWKFCDIQLGLSGEDYVPYRNLVLTALAVNIAAAGDYDAVWTGSKSVEVRKGDTHSFRDSTARFYDMTQELVNYATEGGHVAPKVFMPVLGWTKERVLQRIHDAGIELQMLWSCYRGKDGLPCRECHACQVVREALVKSGLDKQYPHMMVTS